MRNVGHGLWELEQDFKVGGANLGGTMNVIKTSGGLFVHSPLKIDDSIRQSISDIGQPKYVVAPNLFHHMFVGHYLDEYDGSESLGTVRTIAWGVAKC